jgi:hypothetical protein
MVTENLFVNRVETFDGIIPIQSFAPSARSLGTEGLAGRQRLPRVPQVMQESTHAVSL